MPVTYEHLVQNPNLLHQMGPGEFYFHVGHIEIGGNSYLMALIVPRVYWDREGHLWDQCDESIGHLLPDCLGYEMEATWATDAVHDEGELRRILETLGFVWNEALVLGLSREETEEWSHEKALEEVLPEIEKALEPKGRPWHERIDDDDFEV